MGEITILADGGIVQSIVDEYVDKGVDTFAELDMIAFHLEETLFSGMRGSFEGGTRLKQFLSAYVRELTEDNVRDWAVNTVTATNVIMHPRLNIPAERRQRVVEEIVEWSPSLIAFAKSLPPATNS